LRTFGFTMNTTLATACLIFVIGINVPAFCQEEPDPFLDTSTPSPKSFETTGFFKVEGNWQEPEGTLRDMWPSIPSPVEFNRHFAEPSKVWRVEGGYFAAFDGGEWGGGLFFAQDKAARWTRIVDAHIQDLCRFEGDEFLASGGIAHMSHEGGKAFLITRKPTGEWQSRRVFQSDLGVPRIVGTTMTNPFGEANSMKMIVLDVSDSTGLPAPLMGINHLGAVCYLGFRTGFESEKPILPLKPRVAGPEEVVVRKIEESLPDDEEKTSEFLWSRFANKPEEKRFDHVATAAWDAAWLMFANSLTKRAREAGLDSESLQKVLDAMSKDPVNSKPCLPVGAYQSARNGNPVWIVVVKWGQETQTNPDIQIIGGHVRVFAFDQKTLKKIGFTSCR